MHESERLLSSWILAPGFAVVFRGLRDCRNSYCSLFIWVDLKCEDAGLT